jgi:hypothetical protein
MLPFFGSRLLVCSQDATRKDAAPAAFSNGYDNVYACLLLPLFCFVCLQAKRHP